MEPEAASLQAAGEPEQPRHHSLGSGVSWADDTRCLGSSVPVTPKVLALSHGILGPQVWKGTLYMAGGLAPRRGEGARAGGPELGRVSEARVHLRLCPLASGTVPFPLWASAPCLQVGWPQLSPGLQGGWEGRCVQAQQVLIGEGSSYGPAGHRGVGPRFCTTPHKPPHKPVRLPFMTPARLVCGRLLLFQVERGTGESTALPLPAWSGTH